MERWCPSDFLETHIVEKLKQMTAWCEQLETLLGEDDDAFFEPWTIHETMRYCVGIALEATARMIARALYLDQVTVDEQAIAEALEREIRAKPRELADARGPHWTVVQWHLRTARELAGFFVENDAALRRSASLAKRKHLEVMLSAMGYGVSSDIVDEVEAGYWAGDLAAHQMLKRAARARRKASQAKAPDT